MTPPRPQVVREPGDDSGSITAESLQDAARERIRTRADAQVTELARRTREPWLSLRVGDTSVADLPQGAHAVLDGPTGTGKTTLALAIATDHATRLGPAVYVTLELDAVTCRARAIGQTCGVSWRGVLTGTVAADQMRTALPERLDIIDGSRAQLDGLQAAITEVRAAWPGVPVLLIIDYIQLLGLMDPEKSDLRAATARAAETLRQLAERERVGMLLLSQPNRAAARELHAGARVGADTTGVSAETAQLERGATVTLALGGDRPPDADGWRQVDLSAGKSRYGGGDRVWPAEYHGEHGRWRVAGDARSGAEVRQTQAHDREAAAVSAARCRIRTEAPTWRTPLSRGEIEARIGGRGVTVRAAIDAAVAARELHEHPYAGYRSSRAGPPPPDRFRFFFGWGGLSFPSRKSLPIPRSTASSATFTSLHIAS